MASTWDTDTSVKKICTRQKSSESQEHYHKKSFVMMSDTAAICVRKFLGISTRKNISTFVHSLHVFMSAFLFIGFE